MERKFDTAALERASFSAIMAVIYASVAAEAKIICAHLGTIEKMSCICLHTERLICHFILFWFHIQPC